MKIVSQSQDEMVLQEGSTSGMIAGGAANKATSQVSLSKEAIGRRAGFDIQHRRYFSHRDAEAVPFQGNRPAQYGLGNQYYCPMKDSKK